MCAARGACDTRRMTAKASAPTALPLRVPPELRERLDALTLKVPAGLALPRNSVAIAALLVGIDTLSKALDAEPVAVHRALAEVSANAPRVPSRGAGPRRGDGGARAPRAAPDAPGPTPERAPARPAARPRPRAAAAPSSARTIPAAEPADAPTADAVRDLLATVLDRDRSAPSGAKGWTVKALAGAVGCDRRAVQAFRDRGEGMGRPLQLRLWEALRRDPPAKG